MAHAKYNDTKGAFFLTNKKDFGFFDGDNLSRIDEEGTIEAVKNTPEISIGTYLNDIAVKNDTIAQLNDADGKLFSQIANHSRVVGAKFTPLVLSATVELNGKEYEAFATYKNNSDGKYPTCLKLFETIEGKKQEIDVANKRVLQKGDMGLISHIENIFNKIAENADNRPQAANQIRALFTTHPETMTEITEGENKGLVIPNIKTEHYATMLPVFKKIVEENKDLFPNSDIMVENISKFLNNKDINLILMNLQQIFDNKRSDLSNKFGINIQNTVIEDYQIDIASKGNSVSFLYSSLKDAPSENIVNGFKNSYVKEEIRADMQKFVEAAQKDPFVAYHLLNDLKKSVAQEASEYIAILAKEKKGSLSDKDRQAKDAINIAANEKLSVLKNRFPSVNFSEGAFLMDKIGPTNAFSILNAFAAKIATKIETMKDLEKLKTTQDQDRVIRDSNGKSIWYNTSVPHGLGVAEFSKEFGIKGTMGSEVRLKPSLALTAFVIPEKSYYNKNNEQVYVPQKTLLPKNTSTIDKKVLDILTKIDRMNLDGTIQYTPGSNYSSQANIAKEIDFLSQTLVPHEKVGLESKRYQKTKGVLSEIIGFLANNKNNISELKKMTDGIMSGEGFKISPKKTLKDQSVLSALRAVLINNKRADLWKSATNNIANSHRSILAGIVANSGNDPQELKEKKLDKFIYATLHRKALEINCIEVGWQSISDEKNNNEEVKNAMYAANNQCPRNPFTSNPTIYMDNNKIFVASVGMGGNFALNDSNAMAIKTIKDDGAEAGSLMVPIPSAIAATINTTLQNRGQKNNEMLRVFNNAYNDYYDGMKEDWKNYQSNANTPLKGISLNKEIMGKIQAGESQQSSVEQTQPTQPAQKPIQDLSIVHSQTLEENQVYGQEVSGDFDDYDFGSPVDGNPYMDEPFENDEEQYTYNNNERSLFDDDNDEDIEEDYNSRPKINI